MAQKNGKMKEKIVTIPNLLSVFRLALIPVIVWAYLGLKNTGLTGALLLLSGLTDVVDGFIARRFDMISDVGKVLDPVADKLTQAAMLVCLMMRFPAMIVPFVLMAFKEVYMLVSGWLVIRRTGKVLGANWHGKAATVLLYASMFLHVFWDDIPGVTSNLVVALCTGMIALSFALYARRNHAALRGKENN